MALRDGPTRIADPSPSAPRAPRALPTGPSPHHAIPEAAMLHLSLLLAQTVGFGPLPRLSYTPTVGDSGYGGAIALSDTKLLVGSPLADTGFITGVNKGLVHVYQRLPDGSFGNEFKLEPPALVANGQFGTRIAMAAGRAAISSPSTNVGGLNEVGAVHIYDVTGTPQHLAVLYPEPEATYAFARFGYRLDLSPKHLVVAFMTGPSTGVARFDFYDVSGLAVPGLPPLVQTITVPGWWPQQVELDGDRMFAIVPTQQSGATTQTLEFEHEGGTWTPTGEVPNPGGLAKVEALTLDGDRMLVSGGGRVFYVERDLAGWQQKHEFEIPAQFVTPGVKFAFGPGVLDGPVALIPHVSWNDGQHVAPYSHVLVYLDLDGDGVWQYEKCFGCAEYPQPSLFGGLMTRAGDTFAMLFDPQTAIGTHQVRVAPFVMQGPGAFFSFPLTLGADAGGEVAWTVDRGPSAAGDVYLMLGSATGTSPAIPIDGVLLPLAFDAYTSATLLHAGSGTFPGTIGVLDADGTGHGGLIAPPSALTALVGHSLWHAALTLDTATGTVDFASEPRQLAILP